MIQNEELSEPRKHTGFFRTFSKDMYIQSNLAVLPVLCYNTVFPLAYLLATGLCLILLYIPFFRPYIDLFYQIFGYILAISVPFAIFAFLRRITPREIAGGVSCKKEVYWAAIGCALGLSVISGYISQGMAYFMENTFGIYEVSSSASIVPFDFLSFFLQVISICVLPALLEELCFRGVMFAEVSRIGGTSCAIFVTAIAFALIHESFASLPNAFLFGLLAGYLRGRYESVLPGILAHFSVNFSYIIFLMAYEYLSPEQFSGFALLLDVLSIACFILSVSYLINSNTASLQNRFFERFYIGETSSKKGFLYYIISWTMLLFFAYECYIICMGFTSI